MSERVRARRHHRSAQSSGWAVSPETFALFIPIVLAVVLMPLGMGGRHPFGQLFLSFAAIAAEGVTFRMDCGVAGTVTADLGKQIQDDTYYFTSIYAPKLNLIKHGLWGQAGAAHFSVEDSDYTFFYGFDTYIFQLKGKEYQCKPIR